MKGAKAKKSGNLSGEIIRLGGVLLAICTVMGLLLSVVNHITRDRILQSGDQKTQEAMKALAPTARFDLVQDASGDEQILEVYEIIENGEYQGLFVKLNSPSYEGQITLLVGVDAQNLLLGVRIIAHTETEGIGSKITEEGWIAQFEGLGGQLSVVKTAPAGESEIVGITGATSSSRSVVNGVNRALEFARSYTR